MAGRDLSSNIDAIDKSLAYIQDKATREIAANYVYALKDIQKEVSNLYAKYAKHEKDAKYPTLSNAELTKYNRLKGLYQTITTTLKGMFVDVSQISDKMIEDITEESYFQHAWAIEQTAGVSLKWGLLNPDIVDAAVNNDLKYLAQKEVAERTLTQVRRTIAQGIIQGLSYAKMAKALAGTMNKSASGYTRIAQTEGARAQVIGQKASYEQAMEEGVEVEQVWLATLDDKTRDSHRGMDGEVAVNNGTEEEPDWEWNMPGKGWVKGPLLTGYPEEDINCRCSVRPQIKGYEPKLRAARDEGIIEYQTYREWVGRKGEPGTVSDRSAETVRTAG